MERRTKALVIVFVVQIILVCSISAHCESNTTIISGSVFEVNDSSGYEFNSDAAIQADCNVVAGEMVLHGLLSPESTDSINAFITKGNNIAFSYIPSFSVFNEPSGWQLVNDDGNMINGIVLKSNIRSGSLIVQSSFDGENWITDNEYTDIFTGVEIKTAECYLTKSIQVQNGCYYRVVVAYRLRRRLPDKQILLWTAEDYEYKKTAEVYTFYIKDNEGKTSSTDTPRRELGDKVNAGHDNGFAQENAIKLDDPHYGWNLGVFSINGYTRETQNDAGVPVFLKNVGDKITLWFRLDQDINCLNGNSNMVLSEDVNGFDLHFETNKTNFGHGALLIRYTDEQGKKHDPVIYTNYLKACTRTGADTRAYLFEEGDYEISLDYEVKTNPPQVVGMNIVPVYNDYKIAFGFSVRNGNCMVYPFDIVTGSELADKAITNNGFMLDMARSKYLTIDVKHSALIPAANGTMTEDVRFNRPAKDGESYSREGIYVFEVANLYTGQRTTKTIYVGSDSFLCQLSSTGYTVSELNAKLLETENIAINNPEAIAASTQVTENSEQIRLEPTTTLAPVVIEQSAEEVPDSQISTKEDSASNNWFIIGFASVLLIVCLFTIRKIKRNRNRQEK